MHFNILTLFPDFFTSPLQTSILQKAQERNIFSWETTNIRDFSVHLNKNVDDVPYGGGGGMLMEAESIFKAVSQAKEKWNGKNGKVIFFTPTGKKFTQSVAQNFAYDPTPKVLLCGHYEGIDQRVIDECVDEKICIGDCVLTGGEIPALHFIDSVVRLLPNAIGNKNSHQSDTFSEKFFGKGEYPQYTRPKIWSGKTVPEVLLSGDEKKIENWRFENLQNTSETEKKIISLRRTNFSPEKPKKISVQSKEKEKFSLEMRIIEKNDIFAWEKWWNDEKIYQYMQTEQWSADDAKNFWNFLYYNLHILPLSIVEKKSKQVLGYISLKISKKNTSVASMGIVLGEKDIWNKGIGEKVVQEILSTAKNELGIQKISIDCFAENFAAQKLYEKCGFEKIGISKKFYKKNGKFFDALLYEKVL